jgi:hypothetical protein
MTLAAWHGLPAVALSIGATALLAGCVGSTPRAGRTETVTIASEPPGAAVQISDGETCTTPCISDGETCTTPCTANLLVAPDDRDSAHVVRLQATGCQPLFLGIIPYYGPPPRAPISIPFGTAYYLRPNPLQARLSCGS